MILTKLAIIELVITVPVQTPLREITLLTLYCQYGRQSTGQSVESTVTEQYQQ